MAAVISIRRNEGSRPGFGTGGGEGRPKLAESVDRPPEPGGDRNPPGATRGADGFPLIPRPDMIFMDGKARWWVVKGTMQQFAEVLSSLLGRPVADATGLTGQYDYQLTWAMDMAGPGTPPASDDANALPMLPTAIQQQLGLRLEGKKVTLEMVVVDHMEKTPSKN